MNVRMARLGIFLTVFTVLACGCSGGPEGAEVSSNGQGGADNWVIVAPGGQSAVDGNSGGLLHVFRGTARTVSRVPGPPGRDRGLTPYPWAVNGPYVAAVTGIPATPPKRGSPDGEAYAFQPGGKYVPLGPADAVIAASQPAGFWLRAVASGGYARASDHGCTLTEMSASGGRVTGPLPAPCNRWIIAAVPGGFLSQLTSTPAAAATAPVKTWEFGSGGSEISPGAPVQLWNPADGKVIRTYRIHASWILGASDQYLAWLPQGATERPGAVEITTVSTGATRKVTLPVSAGNVIWRYPVLAPRGAYLAWMEVSQATMRKASASAPLASVVQVEPLPGRVKVLDLVSGRLRLNRASTIATAGAFDWSADDRYLFVAAGGTSLNVVRTASAAVPVRNLRLGIEGSGWPDTAALIVTELPS